MELRNDDVVPRDLLQIIRDRAVGGHAALENDVSLVVEQELSDSGNDRARLCPAGSADHLPERHAVLELVDRGGAENGADRRKFQIGIVIGLFRHLLHGNAEFEGDAVEERSGSRRADPAHLGGPHSHLLVVDHRLAVLPADVENRPDMRVVVQRSRHMCGDLADLEIIMDEPFRPFDNLTAGHHRAADVLRRHSGVRQKRHHGLFQCSEIAVPAFRTFAAACDPPGFHRFGPLIGHMFNFSVFRHNDGFERCGTDVDSQIVFLLCHIFRSCIANYKNF